MICHYIVHDGPCLAFREEIKQRGVTGDDAGSCPLQRPGIGLLYGPIEPEPC